MKEKQLIILILTISLWQLTIVSAENLFPPGIIKRPGVNLRIGPDYSAPVLQVLKQGLQVKIAVVERPWVKIQLENGQAGWVHESLVVYDRGTENSRSRNPAEADLIHKAQDYLGIRYRYGGSTESGMDCSGYTMVVFSKYGYKLPHNAAAQMACGVEIADNQLAPGDLVFFATLGSKTVNHVGIYLGNGQFIHASSGFGAVRVSPLFEGYYSTRFRGARRILPSNQSTEG